LNHQKRIISTSYAGLAIKILLKKNEPMHVCDLFEQISKYKKIKGKTPQNSLSSVLQRSTVFKRTSKGYVLVKSESAKFYQFL
jgi:hypothetical protein